MNFCTADFLGLGCVDDGRSWGPISEIEINVVNEKILVAHPVAVTL